MDGQNCWTRAGRYVFLLQVVPADSDIIYGALTPLDVTDIAQNTISPADYVVDWLGPTPAPAGFSGNAISF